MTCDVADFKIEKFFNLQIVLKSNLLKIVDYHSVQSLTKSEKCCSTLCKRCNHQKSQVDHVSGNFLWQNNTNMFYRDLQ